MILGIDLGAKTTGLAISSGQFATPHTTIQHKNTQEAVSSIIRIIEQERVDTVVVGFVEGKIKTMFEKFANALKSKRPDLKIVMHDETLTSGQAQDLLIKLQVSKNRRHQKEHEVAAAIILQSYLDSQ